MKKLTLGLLLFLLPSTAYASSASSTIINNVNTSSSNSNSQTTSHTDITVETDGKVTHYSSDEPNKTIHVESNNGNSKIEVNGQEVSGDENEGASPTITKSPAPTQDAVKESIKVAQKNFLQKLLEKIVQPFKIIFLRLHRS